MTGPVIHRHGRDAPAAPQKERGKKAVHMIEAGDRQEARPAEQLQPAAAVGGGVAEQPGADRVGDPTGEPLDPRIQALLPRADDETKAWRGRGVPHHSEQRGMSAGSFCPSPSKVATHGSPRRPDPVHNRGALTGAFDVPNDPKPGEFRRQRRQPPGGVVVAPVVHANDSYPPARPARSGSPPRARQGCRPRCEPAPLPTTRTHRGSPPRRLGVCHAARTVSAQLSGRGAGRRSPKAKIFWDG